MRRVIHTRRTMKVRRSGQALVEFALIIPVFLLMIFGIIDFGRLVYMNSILSQAAREGARVAAVEASWVGSTDPSCGTLGGPICPANETALRTDITNAANRMMLPFGNVEHVYFSCDAVGDAPENEWTTTACPSGSRSHTVHAVSVRVDMTFTAVTPLIGSIVGPVTTSASSSMVIN
jgi:Flp pilus assembly protein TadG